MATKMNVLGLSAVIVFTLLKPSHSQTPKCRKMDQTSYGCPFQQLSSARPWCEAAKYDKPGFEFYIKPGNNFNGLDIQIKRSDRFSGTIKWFNAQVFVKRGLLPSNDKWYLIQFKSTQSGWIGEKIAYHLSIDEVQTLTTELTLTKGSEFIVRIKGSSFYSAGSCNPGNKKFRPPRPTNQPPLAVATTETNIATSENDLPTTENSSIQPSFMRASKNSTDSDTLRILGEPWWVFVIVGVAFMIIIAVIITAVIMIKKWKENKENETGGNDEEKDTNKITTNNNDWQSQAPAHQFYESDDPANHIYEEPEEDNIEDHIYESVEDLGGPITFVNSNGGQSVPYSVAWQTRRGSSHDSENSIYGCL